MPVPSVNIMRNLDRVLQAMLVETLCALFGVTPVAPLTDLPLFTFFF